MEPTWFGFKMKPSTAFNSCAFFRNSMFVTVRSSPRMIVRVSAFHNRSSRSVDRLLLDYHVLLQQAVDGRSKLGLAHLEQRAQYVDRVVDAQPVSLTELASEVL